MDSPFDTVKDSSIWYTRSSLNSVSQKDNTIYFGIVREAFNDPKFNELRYLVEVRHRSDTILTNCRMMRRWGGVFNYEDFILQGYNYNQGNNSQNGFAAIAGDIVIVASLGGQSREGVILGGLTHKARKSFLDVKKGPQYKSEFNGVETSINEDGEWTLTFKGQPTNLDKLKNTPDQPVPAPEYDKDVGTSFMKWDKTGSFTLSDEATDGDKFQKLFIDKKNGTIDVFSGKINLKFTKKDQSVVLKCKINETDSETSITDKTKNYEVEATDHMHIKTPKFVVESPKVRLGEEGAAEWLILGTTFRKEQKKMDDKVVQELNKAKIALAQVMAQLTVAGGAITAASAVPMAPGVPLAALAPAGTALNQAATAANDAGTAIGNAATAIQGFESAGASTDYQSQVSKTK